MRVGSLFDGSGTAPLAAAMCGFDPVWASEIEPYPIKVTRARFPGMLHLGDITKIDGAKVVPVDIISGGSPCQDLSVAGKQAGLHNGERSHLFFEMTRIIKEMRDATNGKYPRYVIWENVPGAFSSNNGQDFLAVLQAFAEIADPDIHVPEPEKRGKTDRLAWRYAGSIVGDGWSIAWRTVDAQYWGVPQRRRRIYLVADLGSECAGEILFERKSMSGDTAEGGEAWEEAAGDTPGSAGGSSTVFALQANGIDRADTASCNGSGWRRDHMYTLNTIDRHAIVYDMRGNGDGAICHTITGDHESRVIDYSNVLCIGNGQLNQISMQEKSNCLDCMHDKQAILIKNEIYQETIGALCARDSKGIGSQYVDEGKCVVSRVNRRYIIRRLTPLECCRLQGFPDWWEDGVEGSDSARYKMWGNGMALPNMLHVMKGIARMEVQDE